VNSGAFLDTVSGNQSQSNNPTSAYVRTQERTVSKSKQKQPQQTGTFTLDDVLEAVREDRQKDIDAGREYYPMNEARTRAAAGRVEVAAKVTVVDDRSLADMIALAALADEQVERADVCMKRADNLLVSAAYLQEEHDQRRGAMIDAATELVENFADGGRWEHPKMDALPPHDRKEIAGEIIEVLEADLAERKATPLETEALEIVTLLNEGVDRFIEAGRKLIAHKAHIDESGEDWGLWAAKAFPAFAPRTLGRYMTLARRAEDGEAVVMLPASEDSDEGGDLIGLVPPDVSAEESDEIRYDPDTEGEVDDAPDLRQQAADEARRKQQLAEAQARRRTKLAEASGRTVKARTPKDVATQIKRLKSLVVGMDADQLSRVCDMIERDKSAGE
jgi:hypothetical protein